MHAQVDKATDQSGEQGERSSRDNVAGSEHQSSPQVADNRPETQNLTGMQSLAHSGPRATQFKTWQARLVAPAAPAQL